MKAVGRFFLNCLSFCLPGWGPYEQDGLNRLIRVTDPLGLKTEYLYDDRDSLIQQTYANGNNTWVEYDRNNRLVKKIRPMEVARTMRAWRSL